MEVSSIRDRILGDREKTSVSPLSIRSRSSFASLNSSRRGIPKVSSITGSPTALIDSAADFGLLDFSVDDGSSGALDKQVRSLRFSTAASVIDGLFGRRTSDTGLFIHRSPPSSPILTASLINCDISEAYIVSTESIEDEDEENDLDVIGAENKRDSLKLDLSDLAIPSPNLYLFEDLTPSVTDEVFSLEGPNGSSQEPKGENTRRLGFNPAFPKFSILRGASADNSQSPKPVSPRSRIYQSTLQAVKLLSISPRKKNRGNIVMLPEEHPLDREDPKQTNTHNEHPRDESLRTSRPKSRIQSLLSKFVD